jgi:putative transposase
MAFWCQTYFQCVCLQSAKETIAIGRMARRLRIQYPGAIYHLMVRGNGRRGIVRDDADRDRVVEYLGRAAVRCSWRVYAFVVTSNHLHVVLKTPEPNLARGMQSFLSAYANAWSRRHRFNGQVFQDRYRTELIEDESYLWTVTRYVHLNPVRARIVENPATWKWSSYPGYVRDRQRLEWVAYDELLASWAGELGGSSSEPATAYRRYVAAGLSLKRESPWAGAYHGWILGSQKFVDRIRAMANKQPQRDRRREARRARGLTIARVREVVCGEYGIEASELSQRGSRHPARAAMAHLARRHTAATNGELTENLGVSREESVPNLKRRFEAWLAGDLKVRKQLQRLEDALTGDIAIQ